ncbi:hypothetical protein BPORC_1293 [Bifidobacterium porcinum]|nr:hypothetical protein BPORC_1293 [Bifidobacterium porcinum]
MTLHGGITFLGSLVVQTGLFAGAGPRKDSEEKDGIAQATGRPAPNRRTQDEIKTSPQRRRTAMGRQSRNHRKTTEYHGFTYTTKTCHRHTSHATTRARGPNPKSQAETGASPYPNLSAPGPPTTAPPQNHRIPSICLLSYNLQPPNQLPSPPELQTEPENTSRKPVQSTQAPTATRSAAAPVPQTRRIPRIPQHHKDLPPARQPRNHPSPRTEPEITSRNRSQSIPKPVCTGTTNHRTTAKPQNSKYLLAELQSSTIKSAAPARPSYGPNRRTRTENQSSPHGHRPSHAQRPHPCRKPKTPTAHEHHEDQPQPHQLSDSP